MSVLLLALDTSGAAVTAALHDGHRVLAEHAVADPRRHAELLAPTVARVLAGAGVTPRDLTGVVVGIGPGPFTGLRVGLVTGRVLGAALGIPVHGVCSLDALALDRAGEVLVATDARRREVYWARYSDGVRQGEPQVSAAADVPREGLPVIGRGAALYPDLLGPALEPLDVAAGALATIAARALAAGGVLPPPEPLYLRRPDAVEPAGRKRVLQ